MTKIFPDQIFPRFHFTRLALFPDFLLYPTSIFTRFFYDFYPIFYQTFTRYFYPTGLVDDKEDEDNENSTDDEEFVCDNDENDVIILEFSVIVVGNITWI